MSSDAPKEVKESKSVFVGNIPYTMTEEEIVQILSTCGTVKSFRLVTDPETGRPKGFGFCEYTDKDAAASAIRNLSGTQIMGRTLKVDYSHQGPKDDGDESRNDQQHQPMPNGYAQPPPAGGLPPLPPGVDLPPQLSCPEAISQTINMLPTEKLLEILSQMKGLAMNEPAKATELLRQAPQLSFAIFQAMLLMGLVDPKVLASIVEQAPQAPPPAAPMPNMPPSRGPPSGYPAPPPPQQSYGQYGVPGHVPTPPVQNQPYQPPMHQQPPPSQAPAPPQMDREALVKQVLAMSQADIDTLQPQQREQIMQLRRTMGM
ncbi:MAG: hypothetical protein Q9183_001499 [Haloplaca sp. 2 TL-2023]